MRCLLDKVTARHIMEGIPRGNPKSIVEYAAELGSSLSSCIFTHR